MKVRALLGAWLLCTGALLLFFLLLPVGAQPVSASADDVGPDTPKFSPEAAAIFGKRCSACHTYGKGIKVGPDLKGVNDRRNPEWLHKFIHASSQVIKSGDPTATALFAEFKQQRMPDWIDLSDKQIDDILFYIKIGGPDIRPADEKSASLASPDDIEKGRKFFYGEEKFKYGAQACSSCHSVKGSSSGSLGSDLTNVYYKYQDGALTLFLRQPCFQWDIGTSTDIYLTPQESFFVKSFLRSKATPHPKRASLSSHPQSAGGSL